MAHYRGTFNATLPIGNLTAVESIFGNSFVNTYYGFNLYVLHWQPWNWLLPTIAILGYLAMVFFLPYFIKKEYELKYPLAAWNLFLSIASFVMCFFWVAPIIEIFVQTGYDPYYILCMPYGELSHGLNMFVATVFTFSKFFELIDTLFLILRKREVEFLHWYHHTTVLAYCWMCTIILIPVGNIFGTVNAFVHTIMYMYYFLSCIGQKPWWGQYVTIIQLTQMVVGIISTSTWAYYYLRGGCEVVYPYFDHAGEIVIVSSLLLYGSYFLLFLHFYNKRFTPKKGKGKKPDGENEKQENELNNENGNKEPKKEK